MNKYLEIIDEAIKAADKDKAETSAKINDRMREFRAKSASVMSDHITTLQSDIEDIRFWSMHVREDEVLIRNLMAIKGKMLAAEKQEERARLIQKAEDALFAWAEYDPDAEENSAEEAMNVANAQIFEDTHGYSLSEAVNDSSDFYILDKLASEYEKVSGSGCSEDDAWETAIMNVLS